MNIYLQVSISEKINHTCYATLGNIKIIIMSPSKDIYYLSIPFFKLEKLRNSNLRAYKSLLAFMLFT